MGDRPRFGLHRRRGFLRAGTDLLRFLQRRFLGRLLADSDQERDFWRWLHGQDLRRGQRPGRQGRGGADLRNLRRTVLYLSLVHARHQRLSLRCELSRYQKRLRPGRPVPADLAVRRSLWAKQYVLFDDLEVKSEVRRQGEKVLLPLTFF